MVSQVNYLATMPGASGNSVLGHVPMSLDGSGVPQAASQSNPMPFQAVGGTGAATMTPLGYQQITGAALTNGLTPPAGATLAVIQGSGQAVRWRDDGTAPTTSVGMQIPVGGELQYNGNLSAIKFIQVAATATLDVSYYK